MRVLIVSSSLDGTSRSEQVALLYGEELTRRGADVEFVSLKDNPLPRFDNSDELLAHPLYEKLHRAVVGADGLVLAGPVYNWGCCSELKRFLEVVGTTPPDGRARGAFFDKIISFVNAGGLPHAYMAVAPLATSMMFDFKCIINPYSVYVHNQHWVDGRLSDEAAARIEKSAEVMLELLAGLSARTYRSTWEI